MYQKTLATAQAIFFCFLFFYDVLPTTIKYYYLIMCTYGSSNEKKCEVFCLSVFFTDVPVYHTILCCSCCSCCCSFSSVVSKVHFLLALNTFCFCPNLPSPSPPFQIYCQSLDFFLCVHAKKKEVLHLHKETN